MYMFIHIHIKWLLKITWLVQGYTSLNCRASVHDFDLRFSAFLGKPEYNIQKNFRENIQTFSQIEPGGITLLNKGHAVAFTICGGHSLDPF